MRVCVRERVRVRPCASVCVCVYTQATEWRGERDRDRRESESEEERAERVERKANGDEWQVWHGCRCQGLSVREAGAETLFWCHMLPALYAPGGASRCRMFIIH